MNILSIILVASGGAIGSVMRYLMMSFVGRLSDGSFPYGTIVVNVLGSLMMGVLIGTIARYISGSHNLHLLLAVGVLGGFTTFSAFSLDTVTLIERNEVTAAALYVFLSVFCSVGALFLGLFITKIYST